MGEPAHDLLFLDPSTLLGDGGFTWLAETPRWERDQFVVSRTFFDQVAGRAEYTAVDLELWGPLPAGSDRGQLEELLAGLAMFSQEDVTADLSEQVLRAVARLGNLGSQVAVEEWLYLQTHSWLVARTRKILDHFKRATDEVVEIGGNLVLLAAGVRPRRGTPPVLTQQLLVRAGINVVIAGGVPALAVLLPWLPIVGAIVALLIQPYVPAPS